MSFNSVLNTYYVHSENNKKILLHKPADDLLQKIHTIRLGNFWTNFSFFSLKKEFVSLSSDQLKIVLQKLAREEKGEKILNYLLPILSSEKLEGALGLQALHSARDMTREAKNYLSGVEKKASTLFRARINIAIVTVLSMLESFLRAFGIPDFFKSPESNADARDKFNTMKTVFQFALISAIAIFEFAGIALGLLLFFSAIWVMNVIYPYIHRLSATLAASANWTHQFHAGALHAGIPGIRRQEVVDTIANSLIANKNVKMYPLLLGKSGVGKTEIIKMLLAAIENGKYPELKGKRIFYFNAAELTQGGDEAKTLDRISEMVEKNKNNIILVFDHIHQAYQEKDPCLGTKLTSLFNSEEKAFPYVIAIAQEEKFIRDLYAHNPSIAQCFQPMTIQNTNFVETVKILEHTLLKQAPTLLVAPNALRLLIQKSQEVFGKTLADPAASLKLLSMCIRKTSEHPKMPSEQKLQQIRSKIDFLEIEDPSKKKEIAALEMQLKILEQTLAQEKQELSRLRQNLKQLAVHRETMYRTALKVEDGTAAEWEKNQFLLNSQLLIPAMEEKIQNSANQLNVKTVLNAELIDEAIQDELKHRSIIQPPKQEQKLSRKSWF